MLIHDISRVHIHNRILNQRDRAISPSDEDLAYIGISAASSCKIKNGQIKCWNLGNEAKTTWKSINVSCNLWLATSCRMSPYYSWSSSSTRHRDILWGQPHQSAQEKNAKQNEWKYLENDAKTTRKIINVSSNCVWQLAAECPRIIRYERWTSN